MLTNCNVATGAPLKVILIEESITSPSVVQETLQQQGYIVLARVVCEDDLFPHVEKMDPDLLIVNVQMTEAKLLLQLGHLNEALPKPVVVFSGQCGEDIIEAAVQVGVSAFIVDGFSAERLQHLLSVAIARHRKFHSLKQELDKTRENLASRKLIEKAKGLIMRQRKCSEEDAYNALRKLAMDRNQKLVDVAKNVIEVSSLLM
jgi:response regulator NasT